MMDRPAVLMRPSRSAVGGFQNSTWPPYGPSDTRIRKIDAAQFIAMRERVLPRPSRIRTLGENRTHHSEHQDQQAKNTSFHHQSSPSVVETSAHYSKYPSVREHNSLLPRSLRGEL